MIKWRLIAFIYHSVIISLVISSKLNVPRVLLPIFNDFSPKFTLEATDGDCYKWTTSRSDIVKLIPYDDDTKLECSSKVTVKAITKERTRNMAIVLAEDFYTNQVLRCDIIVDVIDSLAIVTTTRELYVEEAPEAFEIRAYDALGNEFTTLEGVEFDWNIVGLNSAQGLTGLKFMPFKDSPYETPTAIEYFESIDKKGHIALLTGAKTGSAKVSVKLPHSEYQHIKGDEVQLSVVANLIISPPEVHIMVGDTVQLKIIQMNSGRMVTISMPSNQYYLSIENKDIAEIKTEAGLVSGIKEGKTKVILFDANVAENENGKFPSCVINVVLPAYMTLSILPYRNWAISLSEHHDIIAEVYSNNNHKLFLGDDVKITIAVNPQFYVHDRSNNGSWLTGWAKEVGVAPLQGTLNGIGKSEFDSEITATAELLIYPHIILNPKEVILPWDPNIKPKYEIEITAQGGDGNYFWTSNNQTIGVVTQTGIVRTHFHGILEISVAMMRNHHNKESALFYVLPPSKIEIIEYIMEAEVGQLIYLYVALYTNHPHKDDSNYFVPFTQCQDLPFNVKLSNPNFVHEMTGSVSSVGISCATVGIVSNTIGVSKVTISYNVNNVDLEDSVTVSTHEALRMLYPTQKTIALPIGISTHAVFIGGPRPYVGRPSVYNRRVSNEYKSIVKVTDITDSFSTSRDDSVVLNIYCDKLGYSLVTLSISNSPILPNTKNKESFAEVMVICTKPDAISLHPVIKFADSNSCPMDASADRIIIPSYKTTEIDIKIRDANNNLFSNISNLQLYWSVNPENSADLGNSNHAFVRTVIQDEISYNNGYYQTITPKTSAGIIKLSVAIQGNLHSSEMLECITRNKVDKPDCIKDEIYLYLAEDPVAVQETVIIYNHPNNKKSVSVNHGSGYYELGLSSHDIANVKYLETTHELEIVPLNEGELQVTLKDLCLSSLPVLVNIYVVSIADIKVEMADKVEIGKCISSIVRLYDEYGNLVEVPEYEIPKLLPELENGIIKITRNMEINSDHLREEIHYLVTGAVLGVTQLKFSMNEVCSSPIDVQVFPPLKIVPKNITLLIGSAFEYTVKGGPRPNIMEFKAENESVAYISNSGLVNSLAWGHTKIQAYSVGTNPVNGVQVTYSHDEVDLYVIPINGIKIVSPLLRFQVGATVPLWVSGLPDQLSPMIIGGVEKSFVFQWTVSDQDIVRTNNVFKKYGVQYLPQDDVCIHVTGYSPGRTTVHLHVLLPGSVTEESVDKYVTFVDSVEIEVYENLVLKSPNAVDGKHIIIAEHSTLQLKTNMDGLMKLQYSVVSFTESTGGSVSNNTSVGVPKQRLTVSNSGLVETYGTLGIGLIVIKAVDKYDLKQMINVVIEIKPVHYMLLNVVTKWRVNAPVPIGVIPVGVEFLLQAMYYDNSGVKFTAANLKLKILGTRMDLIKIRPGSENSSVLVAIKKSGDTILQGFTNGIYRNSDFIKLHAASVLAPSKEVLTIGDVICLWTPLVTVNDNVGLWSSNDYSLAKVEPGTGIGYVTGIESGQVTFGHSLHPSAAVHFDIVPATNIVILSNSNRMLSNCPEASPYRVPLVITSDTSSKKTTNLINGWDCQSFLEETITKYPFTCYAEFITNTQDIHFNTLFDITAGFDSTTGQYTCDILAKSVYNVNIDNLIGNVSVWAVLNGIDIRSKPMDILFAASVSVSPQLLLPESSYSATLKVRGVGFVLDQVQVLPTDKQMLHVHSVDRSETNILKYKIDLLDYHWKLDELKEPLTVIVTSPLTDQIIKVHVKLDFSGETEKGFYHSPILTLIYNYRHLLIIIGSMLVLFFITFYVYSLFIQPIIQVNTTAMNRTIGALNMSNSPNILRPSLSPTRHESFSNKEPIYGDPTTFYTSPNLRRNRRFM
ncbi:hypothetical protein FQA39_LY07251 [Lamprigera yunnana]|nr:hypothetical protein FQA39_LY07251 [Lamprigera yunnana]